MKKFPKISPRYSWKNQYHCTWSFLCWFERYHSINLLQ